MVNMDPKEHNFDLGIWSHAICNIDLIYLQKLIATITKDYNCMLSNIKEVILMLLNLRGAIILQE
jgi:hypothetical protein